MAEQQMLKNMENITPKQEDIVSWYQQNHHPTASIYICRLSHSIRNTKTRHEGNNGSVKRHLHFQLDWQAYEENELYSVFLFKQCLECLPINKPSRTFWSPELHRNWNGLNLANILSSSNVWQIGTFIPITNWQSTRNHQKQFTKLNNVKTISAHENTWKAMCDFIQSERTSEDQLRTKFLNSAFFDQGPDYSIQKDILPRKFSHWRKVKIITDIDMLSWYMCA